MSQLLDTLANDRLLAPPVAVIGDSYGAAMALRWKAVEPRIGSAVAISPYAELSNAVLNLCHDYAAWMPQWLIKAGLRKLPPLLKVKPGELDTTTVLNRNGVVALFVAGANDRIAPAAVVQQLYEQAAPGSKLIVVPEATHEAVPYYFDQLALPVLSWLKRPEEMLKAEGTRPGPD